MNCCVAPLAIDGLAGVTAIEASVAAVTVSTSIGDVTPARLAVMLLVPTPTPVATPPPVPLVIVAVVVVPEVHATLVVMFAVVASLYVPVAVNCCVAPLAIDGLAGVTAIEASVAAVTVSTSAVEVTPDRLAVMLLVPTPTPVATPPPVPLVIVAVVVVPEVHATLVVMFCVEASLYVPVAVNCCVAPLAIDGLCRRYRDRLQRSPPLPSGGQHPTGDVTSTEARRDVARPDSYLFVCYSAARAAGYRCRRRGP